MGGTYEPRKPLTTRERMAFRAVVEPMLMRARRRVMKVLRRRALIGSLEPG